jgi:hypothetical protein
MALGVCSYPYVLLLEANHNTVDHDEEAEGDGAMAAREQGYRGQAEEQRLYDEAQEFRHRHRRARGVTKTPQITAASSGAPMPRPTFENVALPGLKPQ